MAYRDAGMIEVWYSERSTRSKRLAEHLAQGVPKIGQRAILHNEREYRGSGWSNLEKRSIGPRLSGVSSGHATLLIPSGHWMRLNKVRRGNISERIWRWRSEQHGDQN